MHGDARHIQRKEMFRADRLKAMIAVVLHRHLALRRTGVLDREMSKLNDTSEPFNT